MLLCIALAHAGMNAAFAHEPDAEEVALGSLVDAELAFARMGVERGVRDAFLANFADDGIAFEPAPVRLRETWSALAPYLGRGVYVNELHDEGADRVRAAYGTTYTRLSIVKQKYDPKNIFHLNQNIQPAD